MMRRRQDHRRIGGENDVRNPQHLRHRSGSHLWRGSATITSHSCAAEVNASNCAATVASIIWRRCAAVSGVCGCVPVGRDAANLRTSGPMGVTGMPGLSTHAAKVARHTDVGVMAERFQVRRKPQQVGHRHAIRLSKKMRASELSSHRTGNLGRKPLEQKGLRCNSIWFVYSSLDATVGLVS